MKASKDLERFLDFLKSAESQLDQVMAGQQEAEAETQDILHSLELEKHSYHEMAALSRKLAEIRQTRRQHKDTAAQLTPVAEWAKENDAAVRSLQRLLGDVLKTERSTQNQFYTPRTNVLKEN